MHPAAILIGGIAGLILSACSKSEVSDRSPSHPHPTGSDPESQAPDETEPMASASAKNEAPEESYYTSADGGFAPAPSSSSSKKIPSPNASAGSAGASSGPRPSASLAAPAVSSAPATIAPSAPSAPKAKDPVIASRYTALTKLDAAKPPLGLRLHLGTFAGEGGTLKVSKNNLDGNILERNLIQITRVPEIKVLNDVEPVHRDTYELNWIHCETGKPCDSTSIGRVVEAGSRWKDLYLADANNDGIFDLMVTMTDGAGYVLLGSGPPKPVDF